MDHLSTRHLDRDVLRLPTADPLIWWVVIMLYRLQLGWPALLRKLLQHTQPICTVGSGFVAIENLSDIQRVLAFVPDLQAMNL